MTIFQRRLEYDISMAARLLRTLVDADTYKKLGGFDALQEL